MTTIPRFSALKLDPALPSKIQTALKNAPETATFVNDLEKQPIPEDLLVMNNPDLGGKDMDVFATHKSLTQDVLATYKLTQAGRRILRAGGVTYRGGFPFPTS